MNIKEIVYNTLLMNIKEIIYDSMKYSSSDWMKVIILGFISLFLFMGILGILKLEPYTILLIPGIFSLGYLFRVLKHTLEGSDEIPDFEGWWEMFIDGLRVMLVALIYILPVILVSLIPNFTQNAITLGSFSGISLWSFLSESKVQIIVFAVVGIIELMGIANLALHQGKIGAAFRFGEIIRRISTIGWAKYVIWYLIIWIIGLVAFLMSILALNILIGIIVVPLIILPYFALLTSRSLALVFVSSEV
jgi:hypothetical protein